MKFHNNLRNLFWEILIINYIREVVISDMNMCWFLLSCSFLVSAFKLCRLWIKASCHFSCFSLWILGSFSSNEIITAICINISVFETEGLVCARGNLFMCIMSYFPRFFRYKHFRRDWYKVIRKRYWNIWISSGIYKRNGESMIGQRVKL